MTPNTDTTNTDTPGAAGDDAADAPYTSDYYAAYPKSIHLSLRNRNCNLAKSPQTQKKQ